MSGLARTTRAVLVAGLALGVMAPARAAPDPLALPTNGGVDLGKSVAAPSTRPATPRRLARRPLRHRLTVRGARAVPDFARPALTGVAVLAPTSRDYPPLAPAPGDDAAAFTPAFYFGGLARFVTQPPPPVECRRQRRDDAGLPGYVRGAPLYCAQFDQ